MKIYNELNQKENLSVVLGFFDGVHRGHRRVISSAIQLAMENNLKTAIVTFSDSPAVALKKKSPEYLLTKSEKIKFFEKLGVDYLYMLDFDEEFSKITAADYLKNLAENLHPKFITTGYNHYFGYNRSGNTDYLRLMQKEYGYVFNEVEKVEIDDVVVSSSNIRRLLREGDIQTANHLLGYKFHVENEVVKGRQIGRTIGFRTANLFFPEKLVNLPNGVYACEVEFDNRTFIGIANYGSKPTVKNDLIKLLEVYILKFDEDIYGKIIKVGFLTKIRDEKKFESLAKLQEQIEKDIECLEL